MSLEERLEAAFRDVAADARSIDTVTIPVARRPRRSRFLSPGLAAAATVAVILISFAVAHYLRPAGTSPGPVETSTITTTASASATTATATESPAETPSTGAIVLKDPNESTFDGWVYGWRIATEAALTADGIDDFRQLDLTCKPRQVAPNVTTDLDFTLGYPPPGPDRGKGRPIKWVCGHRGLSVYLEVSVASPAGGGAVAVERALTGVQMMPIPNPVPVTRVEAGTIGGHPAVFIHPENDATGDSNELIIDDNKGSYYTETRVMGDDGVPWDELLKVAESLYSGTS